MDIALTLLAGLLVVCGAVACLIPVLPGPFMAYCGLLCLIPTTHGPSVTALVVFGLVMIVATALDTLAPLWGARKFKCSKWGTWGCVVGSLVGMFFFPLGLLLGPFLGAFAGELISGRAAGLAAKGGLGACLGFFAGAAVKFLACLAMLVCYIRCL